MPAARTDRSGRNAAASWQSAAGKTREAAAAAADALRRWTLNDQAQPAVATNGHAAFSTAEGESRAVASAVAATRALPPRRSTGPAPGAATPEILALPQPDWLFHDLTVSGPEAMLVGFRQAAAGAGIVPWVQDYDRLEEDWFLLLMAPPPQRRTISAAGARILARQLRDPLWEHHQIAISQVGVSQACPFDLHALLPVPAEILRLGDDDPRALAWLWAHWGTTWTLRRVAEAPIPPALQPKLPDGHAAWRVSFWAADWSPWRALQQISAAWPQLEFRMQPDH